MHLPSRPALIILSSLLASAAAAQTSSTAPATPPTAPTAPTAATTTPAVNAPNTVTQPVTRPVLPPTGNTPQPPATAVNPLAPPPAPTAPQTVVNTPTTAPGATTPVVDPANIDPLAPASLDVVINPTAALATLRQIPVGSQQTALRTLQARVDATTRALLDLRAQARANGVVGAGPKFDQAAEDVRLGEIALRDALSSAGSIADEAAWRQAQTQIATLYQAYADAVQRARALLRPTPQP